MSLIRRKKQPQVEYQGPVLIPLKQAAAILCLDESTLRKGEAGTVHLTRVRQGTGRRQRVFLVLHEVQAHVESLIAHARSLDERTERHLRIV
ncbi:MAG TPA: hypothetical protein VIQ24_24290 [Pyrinomonadaceae bacterium]